MRIRSRKNLKKKNAAIVFLFLLPILGFGTYAIGAFIIIDDMASYTFTIDPPDTKSFYKLEDINMTTLAQMASLLELRWDLYHSPTNISVDCIFTDSSYTTVKEYVPTDNGGQWTGMMLASECLRYQAAKNSLDQAEIANSMKLIKKMVICFSNFLAAPNGGIGPDYPGIPARFVAAPGDKDLFPFMFKDEYLHYNGTGAYKNWRVRLHTSLDEVAGYVMGLGSVLKFIKPSDGVNASWCYERVRLLVAQLIEGYKRTNWLMITGDGTPCGTNLNAKLGGGYWKLVLLKMGEISYPEIYASEYAYTLVKEQYIHMAQEGSSMNVIMDYYALAFSTCIQYTMILLEENQNLRMFYINQFEEGIYSICRYHRNPFINMAHLVFMTYLNATSLAKFENPTYNNSNVRWDVLDQLYRFHTSSWCPIRDYNLTQRPHSTRATSLDINISALELDPTPIKWRNFFQNNVFGKLYAWIGVEFPFKDHYILPLTVSEMGIDALLWEENVFSDEGGNPTGNGLKENSGMSYTLIYWMGKAFNIF